MKWYDNDYPSLIHVMGAEVNPKKETDKKKMKTNKEDRFIKLSKWKQTAIGSGGGANQPELPVKIRLCYEVWLHPPNQTPPRQNVWCRLEWQKYPQARNCKDGVKGKKSFLPLSEGMKQSRWRFLICSCDTTHYITSQICRAQSYHKIKSTFFFDHI